MHISYLAVVFKGAMTTDLDVEVSDFKFSEAFLLQCFEIKGLATYAGS